LSFRNCPIFSFPRIFSGGWPKPDRPIWFQIDAVYRWGIFASQRRGLKAASQAARDIELINSIDDLNSRWRSNWSKKAGLGIFEPVENVEGAPGGIDQRSIASFFNRYEVRLRVILALLEKDLLTGVSIRSRNTYPAWMPAARRQRGGRFCLGSVNSTWIPGGRILVPLPGTDIPKGGKNG
jgi:hypothetical protein